MKNLRAARRYAHALFEVAVASGQEHAVLDDLAHAGQALDELPDARAVFTQPLIANRAKQDIVDRLFGTVVSPVVCDFLHIVVAHDRGDLIDEIRAEYQRFKDRHEGVLRAEIVSAAPLAAEDAARIVLALAQRYSRRVVATQRVEPVVIGGVEVHVGDQVIDGTVRGALNRLRSRLAKADVLTGRSWS